MNLQKFYMGESFDAYEYFGAHLEDEGVVFRTYAPTWRESTSNSLERRRLMFLEKGFMNSGTMVERN